MKVIAGLMMAGVLVGVAAPAFAGSPAPAPSATPLGDTISVEYGPEYSASNGSLADQYVKLGFSHNLGNGWGMGVSVQDTVKTNNSSTFQPEGSLGYKWKMDALTFGVTGALGVANTSGSDYNAYYAVSGTVDWKLDSKWTWNVINARYRDAFVGNWQTPKVATGVTYKIDDRQAVYLAVGYSWKNSAADKENLAVGYKLGF